MTSLFEQKINPLGNKIYQFWLNLPVHQRGLVIVAIPITCLITCLTVFRIIPLKLIEQQKQVSQSQKIYVETKSLLTAIMNAEIGVQGYLITGQQDYLDSYENALTIIPKSFQKLQPLIQHNVSQQERLELAQKLIPESLTLLKELVQKRERLGANTSDIFPLRQLSPELEKSRDVIEEAKSYLYLISATEEDLLLLYQRNWELQKQLYWLFLVVLVIIGILGTLLAIYLVCRLDREVAEQANRLYQSNQQLSQVNKQLQFFTATVSHELRTPLAKLLSNAQAGLLAPPEDLNQPRKRLEKIVTITKSMSELISNLLLLARQENILQSSDFEPVDLVTLLQQLTEEFSPKAREKELSLQSQFPNSPLVLRVEKTLLYQAVANLLTNAINYSSPGDRIFLGLCIQAEVILIHVEDSGIGIPADRLPLIFKPFYRVDKARSRNLGGFGLGLAIAQQIVQAHGGGIQVKSVVGHGSIFQIELPRKLIQ